MRPVLGNQEKRADEGKGEEHQLYPWAPSAIVMSRFFRHCRLHVHVSMPANPASLDVLRSLVVALERTALSTCRSALSP
jgi:hypothetical protein